MPRSRCREMWFYWRTTVTCGWRLICATSRSRTSQLSRDGRKSAERNSTSMSWLVFHAVNSVQDSLAQRLLSVLEWHQKRWDVYVASMCLSGCGRLGDGLASTLVWDEIFFTGEQFLSFRFAHVVSRYSCVVCTFIAVNTQQMGLLYRRWPVCQKKKEKKKISDMGSCFFHAAAGSTLGHNFLKMTTGITLVNFKLLPVPDLTTMKI